MTYCIYSNTVIINLSVLLYIWPHANILLLSQRKPTNESIRVKTTWLLPKTLVKQLKQYALDNDTTLTAVIIEACTEFLTRKRK